MSAPTSTVMSRIHNMDFFSALPSGLYVLISLSMLYGAYIKGQSDHYLLGIFGSIDNAGKGIFLGVIVVFIAYLFGIGLRSIPTRGIEAIINFLKKIFMISKDRDKKVNSENSEENIPMNKQNESGSKSKEPFPFEYVLKDTYDEIIQNRISGIEDLFGPDKFTIEMTVFNFWKDVLCFKCPPGFQYYQNAEGRVRCFACMFWASIIGLICGISSLILTFSFEKSNPSYILIVLSLLLFFLIISGFNRLRREEAKILFSLYLAYCQDEINTERRNAKKSDEKHRTRGHEAPGAS